MNHSNEFEDLTEPAAFLRVSLHGLIPALFHRPLDCERAPSRNTHNRFPDLRFHMNVIVHWCGIPVRHCHCSIYPEQFGLRERRIHRWNRHRHRLGPSSSIPSGHQKPALQLMPELQAH